MECFRLLFNHYAWIEYQFLSGIRDSGKAGSLWGMMRDVSGVRESIHQSWLAKGLGLGLLCWGLREFRKRFRRKRPALFKSGQWHFHQDNAPVHNFILVTDYLTKMTIKIVPQPPYSPDLDPCDFWLFPKLKGCRYLTTEEMKEAVTKVIDTLTQEDFHGATSCDNYALTITPRGYPLPRLCSTNVNRSDIIIRSYTKRSKNVRSGPYPSETITDTDYEDN